MSNESDDRKHDQEQPDRSDEPADLTIPAPEDTGPAPEADDPSASQEPGLDLHLRGEDEAQGADVADASWAEGQVDEETTATDEPLPPPSIDEPPYDDPGDDDPGYDAPRAPLHHRLLRRPENKIIAGVCSGLGAYTNTDPVLWRIGFVIFGVTSIGVLAYIVAWLVMPEARRGEPLPERPPHEAAQITRWAAIGAIILGCWVIFRGFFHFGGGWFWGLLLIGIGLAVWGKDFTGHRRSPDPDGPPFPPVRPEPWPPRERSAAHRGTNDPTPPANPATPSASSASAWPGPRPGNAPTTPLPPTRPPTRRPTYAPPRAARRYRRESSYLGRLVVGACALVIGLGLVLNNTGVIDLTAKGLLAVLVAIVGAGLITGAWAGRARWLIFPGLLLSAALLLATWAPAFTHGSFGDIVWQPQSRKALLPSYEHGAGQAVLDLTEVAFDEREREVEVDLNFGELLVVVPKDVPVTAMAHVQGGEIDNFGQNSDGWDVANTRTEDGDEDIGRLTIDAEVVFGELTIRRERSSDDFTPGSSNDGDDFNFDFNAPRFGRP